MYCLARHIIIRRNLGYFPLGNMFQCVHLKIKRKKKNEKCIEQKSGYSTIYINAILTPSSRYYRYFKFKHELRKGKGGVEREGDKIDERIK